MNFRKQAPAIHIPDNVVLKSPEIFPLSNGIEVHYIESGTQEVLLLELCFKAGRWYESKPQLSHFTHSILKEGTYQLSSSEIAEKLEYYGANLKVFVGFDYCTIAISTISRFLEPCLDILRNILEEASFPEEELNIYRNHTINEFRINQTKHEYIATKTFSQRMWGTDHPYGYPTREADMMQLSVDDLKHYFKQQYCPENAVLFVAGFANFKLKPLLDSYIGKWQNDKGVKAIERSFDPSPNYEKVKIDDKQAHQVSLRIGLPIITRTDEEFVDFYVLNTVLGGYFGARLMANIREDKGYTYGIYSTIVNMVHGSYMYINTEVGQSVWNLCVDEIYKEINRLKSEKVGEEEFLMVKNYLSGYLLSLIDGGFNRLANYKDLYFQGLNAEYFNNFARQISKVKPEAVQQMAIELFNEEKILEIAVGDIQ